MADYAWYQATDSLQLARNDGGTEFNNNLVIFGNSGDYMTSPDWGTLWNNCPDLTLYGAIEHTDTATSQDYLFTCFGATDPFHPWIGFVVNPTSATTAYLRLTMSNSNGNYTSINAPSRTFTDGTKKVFHFCFRLTNGTAKFSCETLTDETTNASFKSTLNLATYPNLDFNQGSELLYSRRTTAGYWNGKLGLLWLYPGYYHADATVTNMFTYLSTRFGTSSLGS